MKTGGKHGQCIENKKGTIAKPSIDKQKPEENIAKPDH